MLFFCDNKSVPQTWHLVAFLSSCVPQFGQLLNFSEVEELDFIAQNYTMSKRLASIDDLQQTQFHQGYYYHIIGVCVIY